jgi:hypothetical protein
VCILYTLKTISSNEKCSNCERYAIIDYNVNVNRLLHLLEREREWNQIVI